MARKRDDSKGLSIRAYAEHRRALGYRGANTSAIQKALQSGRIRSNTAGRIDPARADAEWERATVPPNRELDRPAPAPAAAAVAVAAKGSGRGEGLTYSQSRSVREAYEAKLKKLSYETKAGKLIPADDVKLEAFRRARSIRDRMLSIPARVAGTLAQETDPHTVEQLLQEAIATALEAESIEP
jgi:hypothetical protein